MTGGAQGLGLVCARALLEHSVSHLAIFDVDEKQGAAALEHYQSVCDREDSKPAIVFRKVDVTNEEIVNDAVKEISSHFGGIDILICFAGITGSRLAVEYPIEDWRRIFDVNVHGSFLVARAVARFVVRFEEDLIAVDIKSRLSQLTSEQRYHRPLILGYHCLHRLNVRIHRQHAAATLGVRYL